MQKKNRIAVFCATIILCICVQYSPVNAETTYDCGQGSHQYVSRIIMINTEAEAGQVENTCELCGDSYIEYLPATGHQFGDWSEMGQEQSGESIFQRKCRVCHRYEERRESIPVVNDTVDEEVSKSFGGTDIVLMASTMSVWGYAAVVLWYNSLVLNWHKREMAKKRRSKI